MSEIKIQKIGITDLDTDAIVNAANEGLVAGSGVCGAIFKAAGYGQLQAACAAIGHCDTGSAVITDGFDVKAKYIIHAVGPKWSGGNNKEAKLLYGAYWRSMELAMENNCHSIGFPLISTGVYGYPKDKAWRQALLACYDFLQKNPDSNLQVVFAVIDDGTLVMGQKILAEVKDGKDTNERLDIERFVNSTICKYSKPVFEEVKNMLLDKYVSFSIIDDEEVTEEILAEKLCDYFSMVELHTRKAFEKQLESFINDLDSIVEPKIAQTPSAKKGDTDPVVVPRSRKYYEKAIQSKGQKNIMIAQLIDYSRLMMCLYTSIIDNKGGIINNFDYSVDCLDPRKIIRAMKNEEVSIMFSKKKKFDTKDLYGTDACTLVISILMLWTIINGKVQEGNDNE